MSKIFISYSHDSEQHANRVLDFANKLVEQGVDCILDQWENMPIDGWPRWMDTHVKTADFVLMICTDTYYNRVMGLEQPGKGRGVRWEGNLIYQYIYDNDSKNSKFLPLLFSDGNEDAIPTPLRGATRYTIDTNQGYDALYRHLTGQPLAIKPRIGHIKPMLPRERKQDFFGVKLFTSKLPITSSKLFGRENELSLLDATWAGGRANIVCFVAFGGVGKSALVNEWLDCRMAPDNYRGAERVYGWSFYSQGTKEDRQASSDEFLSHALSWFGDADPAKGTPWDKGARLADLVRKQRTLLVLDGLEPLQYPPGPMAGKAQGPGNAGPVQGARPPQPGAVRRLHPIRYRRPQAA